MKEQLNNEKIRLRRSQVIQSRIPIPASSYKTRSATASARPNSSGTLKSSLMGCDEKIIDRPTGASNETQLDLRGVARVRYRVLRMLEEYDPAKVEKIDVVMTKFEGREKELLKKMTARYESNGKDDLKSIASTAEASQSNKSSIDGRPKSRQDMSLERHMERMKRIRTSASKKELS